MNKYDGKQKKKKNFFNFQIKKKSTDTQIIKEGFNNFRVNVKSRSV